MRTHPRNWQVTLFLKKETGWSPLPDSGHIKDTFESLDKQTWRCLYYGFYGPIKGLINLGSDNNSTLLRLIPNMRLVAEYDITSYIVLDLSMLLILQKQTNVFDSFIEAIKDWRSNNNHVVLVLYYTY